MYVKQERVPNTRDAKKRRIEKARGRKEGFLNFFVTRPFVFTRAQFNFSLFPFQDLCISSQRKFKDLFRRTANIWVEL